MKSLKRLNDLFRTLVSLAEFFGLAVIAVATTYAMGREAWGMLVIGRVTLTDLLLMFLYLEILVMVTQYFKAGQLPVKFPLYIAIVSLARQLILNIEKVDELHMLASAAAILLISFGVLVIRYGQFKFPENFSLSKDEGKGVDEPPR
jgi:protein PsiE